MLISFKEQKRGQENPKSLKNHQYGKVCTLLGKCSFKILPSLVTVSRGWLFYQELKNSRGNGGMVGVVVYLTHSDSKSPDHLLRNNFLFFSYLVMNVHHSYDYPFHYCVILMIKIIQLNQMRSSLY